MIARSAFAMAGAKKLRSVSPCRRMKMKHYIAKKRPSNMASVAKGSTAFCLGRRKATRQQAIGSTYICTYIYIYVCKSATYPYPSLPLSLYIHNILHTIREYTHKGFPPMPPAPPQPRLRLPRHGVGLGTGISYG